MASVEQRALAEDVKAVHRKLREQLLEGAEVEEVWKKHVQDQETLDKYSESMKLLATSYWESSGEESRVQWVKSQVESYFWGGGVEREARKDQKRLWRSKGDTRENEESEKATSSGGCNLEDEILGEGNGKDGERSSLRVLDVGSCYNPFGELEGWQVLPVDIAPATPSVKLCDFLSVELAAETVVVTKECNRKTEVKSVERGGYHVVIFCLLLEYLPSSALRLQAVEKAVGALKEGGLLCIVTPDSCHQARNSEQLSSWKFGLGLLGLSKVTYTKAKHFHGLVYRKPSCFQMELVKSESRGGIGRKRKNEVSSKEDEVENETKDQPTNPTPKDSIAQLESLFYIPQDFSTQVNCKRKETVEISPEERFQMVESFSDLPMDI